MPMSERELLRLHVEAVWDVRLPLLLSDEVELLSGGKLPLWAVYLGALPDGTRVHMWRPDVINEARQVLRLRAHEAFVLPATVIAGPEVSREVALHQVAAPQLNYATARRVAQPLSTVHRPLLEAFDPGAADHLLGAACAPLFGVIVEGRLLSLAHSARRTKAACELGVDTLPAARRRGYALAVTLLWAEAVAREGCIPFYSALAENTASLALAAAAGYRPFACGASITG